VYDGEWKNTSIGLFFNRQISKLVRASIPVSTIRGNHDARSVVTQSVRLSAGVIEFPSTVAATETLANLKIAIRGRSFPVRAVPENYALSYPKAIAGFFQHRYSPYFI
jgi:DNA repair exonuclease SbcCD nuclease subunit